MAECLAFVRASVGWTRAGRSIVGARAIAMAARARTSGTSSGTVPRGRSSSVVVSGH